MVKWHENAVVWCQRLCLLQWLTWSSRGWCWVSGRPESGPARPCTEGWWTRLCPSTAEATQNDCAREACSQTTHTHTERYRSQQLNDAEDEEANRLNLNLSLSLQDPLGNVFSIKHSAGQHPVSSSLSYWPKWKGLHSPQSCWQTFIQSRITVTPKLIDYMDVTVLRHRWSHTLLCPVRISGTGKSWKRAVDAMRLHFFYGYELRQFCQTKREQQKLAAEINNKIGNIRF